MSERFIVLNAKMGSGFHIHKGPLGHGHFQSKEHAEKVCSKLNAMLDRMEKMDRVVEAAGILIERVFPDKETFDLVSVDHPFHFNPLSAALRALNPPQPTIEELLQARLDAADDLWLANTGCAGPIAGRADKYMEAKAAHEARRLNAETQEAGEQP